MNKMKKAPAKKVKHKEASKEFKQGYAVAKAQDGKARKKGKK